MNTKYLKAVVFCGMLSCVSAGAVELDSGGEGQVLVLPVWTTTGGHSTLLQVQPSASAIVRLRVLDNAGAVVLSGNLYFEGVWTAGIGAVEGGGSRLVSNSDSCLLLSGDDGVMPLDQAVDIAAEAGSLEVIVMGRPDSEVLSAPENQALRDALVNTDCDALATIWNEGVWSTDPAFGLDFGLSDRAQVFASWSIVQVDRGTLYSVPGVALDGYSDRVQHTPPSAALPDLASGHDDGTDLDSTHSRNCNDGVCREDTWPTPLDAMAAALMAHSYRGDYAIDPGLGAATDLVFNYPLAPYYAARDGDENPLSAANLAMDTLSRSGEVRAQLACPSPPPPGTFCRDTYWSTSQAEPMLTVSFNSADTVIAPSGLLGLPAAYRLERPEGSPQPFDPLHPVGIFRAELTDAEYNDDFEADLISNEGTHYFGAPVLAVVFQQFVNGLLPAGDGVPQRANYGASFAPSKQAFRRLEVVDD